MLREADELAPVWRIRFLLLAAASCSGSGPGPAGFIASFGIVVAGTLRDMLAASRDSGFLRLKTRSDILQLHACVRVVVRDSIVPEHVLPVLLKCLPRWLAHRNP